MVYDSSSAPEWLRRANLETSLPRRAESGSELLRRGPTEGERNRERFRTKGLRLTFKRHFPTHLHTDGRIEVYDRAFSICFDERPSLNPDDRLRAKQRPDHPVNTMFTQGRIPRGEGTGPFLLWDGGTYRPLATSRHPDAEVAYRELVNGRFDFWFEGARVRGGYRMEWNGSLWIVSKLDDECADPNYVPPDDVSVLDGRTLADFEREFQASRRDSDLQPSLDFGADAP